ncbi:MAG TPA: homocysteine S-methyltransferase family protein [Devosia sp.]|nr:homocysteine S-methyltransferase family protein [Devosia sp.]
MMTSPKYRAALPQLKGGVFLADGGMETSLIFHDGIELPLFASFVLLRDDAGREALTRYFAEYLDIARERGVGFIVDTATWRANPDWATKLDIGPAELDRLNREAVALALSLRDEFERTSRQPGVVNGVIGPRGDGYRPDVQMAAREARLYHGVQIASLAAAGVDMVSAITMNYINEAIGIALAAKDAGVPCVISFTVETDGNLASGATIGEAITAVEAATGSSPAYYMINCAHPRHFAQWIPEGAEWIGRVRGVRANASTKSHAELDESETLDIGDPVDLAQRYRALRTSLPQMNVVGGCCGTDHRHISAICDAILPADLR